MTSLVIHHIIKTMNKTAKKLIQILSIIAALALICLYPVPAQDAIVSLVERMKHDTIRAAPIGPAQTILKSIGFTVRVIDD